jgi:hypothetical protein
MYNLIWRSVTCRPGNGGLLSGVKRPIIAQTIATARRRDPIKDHTVASVVPPIGLRPHSGTTLATLSHPDCRSVLTLIVAGQMKPWPGSMTICGMWWNVSERSISSLQHPETNERATANVPPACLKPKMQRFS